MSDNITSILTANLSDRALTEMQVVAAGTYTVATDKTRICKEKNKEGNHVDVLRFAFRITSPAKKHNSQDIWPSEVPIQQQIGLVPTEKMSQDYIVRNLAGFIQATGEQVLLTESEAAEFNTHASPYELPLPRFDSKSFLAKVTVKPDNDGNPRNNLMPVFKK